MTNRITATENPSEMDQSKDKEKYIKDTLAHLEEEPLLRQFGALFLEAFPWRALQAHSHSDLAEFVRRRFEFFCESRKAQGKFRMFNPEEGNKTIFEVVYPYTTRLLFTLECLFRKYEIRILFKLHPLMTVCGDGEENVSIHRVKADCENMAVIYIELERIDDEPRLRELSREIGDHILAIKLAYEHGQAMLEKLDALRALVPDMSPTTTEPKEEWIELLEWLRDQNFSFLGYVAVPLHGVDQSSELKPLAGSGLGILSDEFLRVDRAGLMPTLLAHVWRHRKNMQQFMLDTINVVSPVQRFENLMRLSLRFAEDRKPVVHNFVGLVPLSSVHAKNSDIPVVRAKIRAIFQEQNIIPHSYDYNQVIRIFNSMPKFEVFRTSATDLMRVVHDLLSITDPDEIQCFAHFRSEQSRLLVLVVMPTALFTAENVEAVKAYLQNEVPHAGIEIIEMSGVSTCRLHVYFDLHKDTTWEVDVEKARREISERIKSWEEMVRDTMAQHFSMSRTKALCARYLPGMPNHYRARNDAESTVRDISFLEEIGHDRGMRFNLTPFDEPGSALGGCTSLLYVYSRKKIDLIYSMPILQNAGLYVIDQLNARIGPKGKTLGYIQSFRVQNRSHQAIDMARQKDRLEALLLAVFEQRTENDPLNALVLLSDLDWRAINVLQLYRNQYLQLGSPHARETINAVLCSHPRNTRLLFEYFETKFSTDPRYGDQEYRLNALLPRLRQKFQDALREVHQVTDDMVLRRLFTLIDCTLRTNFYMKKSEDETAISVKLDSKRVEHIPVPVPFREIYVHDVGLEGVHLRFGPVARGGLRWSDRLDDFRTEILGLVKAQQTKNVVIVPVGSKGGFVIKKTVKSREEASVESQRQYRKFIASMLDITDNIDPSGQVRQSQDMVRYDDLDPYFVVAADKGTATFSDIANGISLKYRFWLGDAFASGGSVGYDHKKEGITARGAWECVKLHFRERGKDIQTEVTTVAGIGDMGGDVFGNGMLLSRCLKLKAAFNHLHIFLDPDPDPEASWEERKRLFEADNANWSEYRRELISTGGGVFDRNAKEIMLSPQAQEMLCVDADILNGEEVIRAILKMDVELFWLGGIGTYVKATTETDFEVGDQTNDAVRISMDEFRANVVGEGANLGITQLGRLEFDRLGGHINTDFIDNSAGVNMSDYEVNIKILLQQMLQDGHIGSMEERNEILRKATDEVAELVLANNRGNHRLISMDKIRSQAQFKLFKQLVPFLVNEKGMDAESERIPSRGEFEKMEKARQPIQRSVLSVLQAYVKMWMHERLLESDFLDDPFLEDVYRKYFPATLRDTFGDKISNHRLRREIISTQLTNKLVNTAGCAAFFRIKQLTGKPVPEIAKAYLIINTALKKDAFHHMVLAEPGVIEHAKYQVLIEVEDVICRLVQSLLQSSTRVLDFSLIHKFSGLFDKVKRSLADTEELRDACVPLEVQGFSGHVAEEISAMRLLDIAPDIVRLVDRANLDAVTAMGLVRLVNDLFDFEWIKQKVLRIELDTDWEMSHQDILIQNIESYKRALMRFFMRHHDARTLETIEAETLLAPLRKQCGYSLEGYFETVRQLKSGAPITLTSLTVVINRLNFVETTEEG